MNIKDNKDNLNNFNNLVDRIDYLHKNEKNIEAIIFLSIILESILNELLICHEKNFEANLKKYKLCFDLNLYKVKPRGFEQLSLIKKYLSAFIKNDVLFCSIESFINLRNKCAHDLLSVNISALEKKAKNNFLKYKKTIITLYKIHKEILEKTYLKKMEISILFKFATEQYEKYGRTIEVGIVKGVPSVIKNKKQRLMVDGETIFVKKS